MKSSRYLPLPSITIFIIPFGVGVGMVSRKIKKDLIRDVFNISIERGMAVQNERINVNS